jgi:hypothetical protein
MPPLRMIETDRTSAERSGALLRHELGLEDLPTRLLTRPEELLRELVRRVEQRGYLVIQVQRVPVGEMRGFSIHWGTIPSRPGLMASTVPRTQ